MSTMSEMLDLPLTKTMQRIVRDDAVARRLVAKTVETHTGCWEWQGAKNADGYGYIQVAGKTRKAHRVSYSLFCEPIPDGMLICHHCDTPACINPNHLFPSTHVANMRDMIRKGRGKTQITSEQSHFRAGRAPNGEAASGAKLTLSQVEQIRLKHGSGVKTKRLAEEYGVDRTTIQMIMRGQTWKHLGRSALAPEIKEGRRHGEG